MNVCEVADLSLHKVWWDPLGPFKILHKLAPLRLQWILRAFFSEDTAGTVFHHLSRVNGSWYDYRPALDALGRPLQHLRLLDIGCGGGLLSEPMAYLGASVIGVDQCADAVACARGRTHAFPMKENLSYEVADIRDWTPPHSFHIILAMEVLEHLPHPFSVLKRCASWLYPHGILIGSTLSRTWISYLLGIIGAEYILRWIPRGTHQWRSFLKPSLLHWVLSQSGFDDMQTQGFFLKPGGWQFSKCMAVNYFFSGRRCH